MFEWIGVSLMVAFTIGAVLVLIHEVFHWLDKR